MRNDEEVLVEFLFRVSLVMKSKFCSVLFVLPQRMLLVKFGKILSSSFGDVKRNCLRRPRHYHKSSTRHIVSGELKMADATVEVWQEQRKKAILFLVSFILRTFQQLQLINGHHDRYEWMLRLHFQHQCSISFLPKIKSSREKYLLKHAVCIKLAFRVSKNVRCPITSARVNTIQIKSYVWNAPVI